jgi:exodeoxyribonuclease VII large subunit
VKLIGARQVWAVREITAALGRWLEGLPSVWVEAEVHNLRQRGGQVYFTLRDGHQIDASMRAVLFERLPAKPADGSLVYAFGRVEFWPDRTQLSLRVERLEPAGEGALLAEIEAIKNRLAADGLLADARKRALPAMPRRIGLITSAVGAARGDVLNNLWARFPADVVLVDVPVQGPGAPGAIIRALDELNAIDGVEVVVIARGGGPLEDLMAFNDERLCRAVAASGVPVVSAVGHEKDVTICDLVADRRVSTPTGAAEVVVPDMRVLVEQVRELERLMVRGLARARDAGRAGLDRRQAALAAGLTAAGTRGASRVAASRARLAPALERARDTAASAVPPRDMQLGRAFRQVEATALQRLVSHESILDALSPSRTVARGYAIIRDVPSGRPVVSSAALRAGDRVDVEMRDGQVGMTVIEADQ